MWTRGVLNHFFTRVALSIAIIFSLLPMQWLSDLNVVFLLVFGAEFGARAVLLFRGELHGDDRVIETEGGWTKPRAMDVLLLGLDLIALLSFIPFAPEDAGAIRWLRLFRLTRMLMLLKYWGPLARDLYSVLVRRERLRQVVLMGVVVLTLSFAGAVILDHATLRLPVDFDGDGDLAPHDSSFWVRLWWAFRQIQDPGNMLANPEHWLVLVVSVALTVFGLFLVSFLIGLGTDVVRELMELTRLRSAGLRQHTVVVNITPSTRQLLFELIRHYRKLLAEGSRLLSFSGLKELTRNAARRRNFLIVGRAHDAPDFLREPEFARIVYRQISPDDDDESFLERADIATSRRVLIFADSEAEDPDDETIRQLLTVVERLPESRDGRRRKLIAEVFDESNILAARKAVETAHGRVQAYVVPTERLLALFLACVTRRTNITALLVELLTSLGHELYTYDYRHEASGSVPHEPPKNMGTPAEALHALHQAGIGRAAAHRLVPVGVLYEEGDPRQINVGINPEADEEVPGRLTGFVSIAPNFRVVGDFAMEFLEGDVRSEKAPRAIEACPVFERAPTTDLSRVLLCGFRSATVNLIEALVTADQNTQILILVPNEKARLEVFDDFDSYTRLVESEMLTGRRGTFTSPELQPIAYIPAGEPEVRIGKIFVEVGNWTSARQLMKLPHDFGSVADVSAVVLISDEHPASDARTTTALMKIEGLVDHQRSRKGGQGPQRIVAEVLDAELAQRLIRRYSSLKKAEVRVFSIQELRAFFMFQAVVVPHFDLVYAELMAPWGQSFVQLRPTSTGSGYCTFAQLAAHLREHRQLLIAVELEGSTRKLCVGEGDLDDHDRIDLARLRSVWVIDEDREPTGHRAATAAE
jgi:hypothetical protein